jgi:DNA adenine methylase
MESERHLPGAVPILRYPGGKRRTLAFLSAHLPQRSEIHGRYVEPFFGGGAVFFYLRPRRALISDANPELIDLYRGIRSDPGGVWERYVAFGAGKTAYVQARQLRHCELDLTTRAARLLYLNRTCFKGMWRHNRDGQFNVGYGGQSRRWVVTRQYLVSVSRLLRRAAIRCSDFEPVVDSCVSGDYVFVDPPYRPGQRELLHTHYTGWDFTFEDHRRLASALRRASERGVRWSMTTSSHPDIVALFWPYHVVPLPRRTKRGLAHAGEVLILSDGGRQ